MLYVIERCNSRQTFLLSSLFFLSYILLTFSFLLHQSAISGGLSLLLALIPWGVYTISLIPILLFKNYKSEVFIVLWIIAEMIFANIELGNPLLQIGCILSYWPESIQWYQYTGAVGGSIWLLILCYLLFRMMISGKSIVTTFFVLLLLPMIISVTLFEKETNLPKMRSVAVVSLKRYDVNIDSILLSNNNITQQYIVCPEAIMDFEESHYKYSPKLTRVRRALIDSLDKTIVILGVWMCTPSKQVYNSIIAYSKMDSSMIRYKKRLMPFGEYLPYSNIIEYPQKIKELVPYLSIVDSLQTDVSLVGEDSIAMLICYEALCVDYLRLLSDQGAEVFFVSASNNMINSDHTEKQIHNILVANAISFNKSFARAAENGCSYIINDKGQTLTYMEKRTGYIYADIYFNKDSTFYTQHFIIINDIYRSVLTILLFLLFFASFLKCEDLLSQNKV